MGYSWYIAVPFYYSLTMKTFSILLFLGLFHLGTYAQEICNNGVDDDVDGLVDLNDEADCECVVVSDTPESLIPNASFEESNCTPFGPSELNCANLWNQATEGTSDFFLISSFWPPAMPQPAPAGVGSAGFHITRMMDTETTGTNYIEYLGACLTAPMEAGVSYTLQMQIAGTTWNGGSSEGVNFGAVDITIFGSPDCPTWPLSANFTCPIGITGWSELGATSYEANGGWSTITINFTPTQNIEAMMIGGPCDVPEDFWRFATQAELTYPYFFVDNLIINSSDSFNDASVDVSGDLCTEDLILTADPDDAAISVQWFQEGVALVGQTENVLDFATVGYEEGTYQFVTYLPNESCLVSVIPVDLVEPEVPSLNVSPLEGCAPMAVNFANENLSESDVCAWRFGDGIESAECAASHTYTQPGSYDVFYSVTNSRGCMRDTLLSEVITVYALPEVSLTASDLTPCIPYAATFSVEGTSATNYTWYFANDDETLNGDQPTINYLLEDTAEVAGFEVILIAYQRTFCSDTASIRVFPADCGPPVITYPNVFTPNGDGDNDAFFLTVKNVAALTLTVYNRWGTQVFEKSTSDAENNNVKWNGEVSGTPATDGVYYFYYTAKGLNGEEVDGGEYVHLLSAKN